MRCPERVSSKTDKKIKRTFLLNPMSLMPAATSTSAVSEK